MKGWRVHADKLAEKNYGLVSDGFGFEDSPGLRAHLRRNQLEGPRRRSRSGGRELVPVGVLRASRRDDRIGASARFSTPSST